MAVNRRQDRGGGLQQRRLAVVRYENGPAASINDVSVTEGGSANTTATWAAGDAA